MNAPERHPAPEPEALTPWQPQAEALLHAAEELNGASNPEQILLRVVAIAARLLAVERVALATNEGDHARRRYTWDEDGWHAASVYLPLDDSIAGWIIRHRRSYRSDDLAMDSLLDGTAQFKTLLAVPILARDGRALGALNLHERRDGCPFSDADQRLAEGIAHHAAVALERAVLLTEIHAYVGALEAKTREQEAFIHTVSHAFKTPLASIRAMSELLVEASDGDRGSLEQGLQLIVRNANRLQQIMEDLLAFAQANTSLQDLEPEPVALDAVLAAAQQELATVLAIRDVQLTIAGPLPWVLGHVGRLTEVFTNLLDNAINYVAPERQPAVTVGARGSDGMVECWVSDNGVGIAVDQRERVFDLFRRLDAAHELRISGSGAGLAIVRRIVERYGGRIWVEDGESGGASLHLTLVEYVPPGHDSPNAMVVPRRTANGAQRFVRAGEKPPDDP